MRNLVEWSTQNWLRVPELVRNDCVRHLRSKIPDHVVAKWKAQLALGGRIGEDDPNFHFGAGIQIRNILREQLTDLELPLVENHRNWDDYYLGALYQMVREASLGE